MLQSLEAWSSCKKYNLHVACVREMIMERWHQIYVSQSNRRASTMVETRVPLSLKNGMHTAQNGGGRSKSKVRKCVEMAGMVVQIVMSVVLGDLTVLITGIMWSLMSRA
ncbi:hypothetical protein KIW84_063035 [Lathyrus oleraceus]|uniref:Uncharacterized protein n=1 Tax=Pisum sativum TaxID=3888 RepID=A0A9D5A744_PEA|nr:hypothetical protein KIW84_063035 [Pisum sativum]